MGDLPGGVVASQSLGFLAGVVGAQVRVTGRAGHAAAAAVGGGEGAAGRGGMSRHGDSFGRG